MSEPRIVNRTALTAADQKAFQRVQLKRSLRCLLPAALLLAAGGGVWLILSPEDPFVPVFVMALGAAFPLLYLLSFAAAAGQLNRGFSGLTLTYAFSGAGFAFSLHGGEQFLSWTELCRAEETGDAFYLYVDRRSAAIIKKNGFEPGGAEALRALLTDRLGKKFSGLRPPQA